MCPRARYAVGLPALATAFVVAMTSVGWGAEHVPDVELEPLRVVAADEAEAFRLVWSYRETWRRQEPIEARDRGERRSGFLGSMVLRYTPVAPDNVMLSLACDNLWDSAFETFVGQPPAGRRLTLSLGAVF